MCVCVYLCVCVIIVGGFLKSPSPLLTIVMAMCASVYSRDIVGPHMMVYS